MCQSLISHVPSPVIVDHLDEQSDVLDVLVGNVEHERLVVHGVKGRLLHARFLLLDAATLTHQTHLHVRIWG